MNCDEYLPLISGHLDGANSDFEEHRLQEHLQTCEACRALLSQMEQNDALLRNAAAEPPADLTDRIMRQVRKEKQRSSSSKKRWIPIAVSGVAAAALLGLVVWGALPSIAVFKGAGAADSAQYESATVAYAPTANEENALDAAAPEEAAETDGGRLLTVPTYQTADAVSGLPDLTGSETAGYTGYPHRKAAIYGSASSVPTLIIWDAGKLDTLAGCEPETSEETASLPANGATLYSRILTAIPLRDPDYGITIYAVSYDTMMECFSECVSVYENVIYYPAANPTQETCSVVLIDCGE